MTNVKLNDLDRIQLFPTQLTYRLSIVESLRGRQVELGVIILNPAYSRLYLKDIVTWMNSPSSGDSPDQAHPGIKPHSCISPLVTNRLF